jgi:sirohydrochlorin ferrochelatase
MTMNAFPIPRDVGVVLVDHGSRREAANAMLHEVAALFRAVSGLSIVEPAHMELAEPTIAQAFERCVEQGARTVVVHPYCLSPGRHSREDIPRLAADAATKHPDVALAVTEPLGLEPRLCEVVMTRVQESLRPENEAASEAAAIEILAL